MRVTVDHKPSAKELAAEFAAMSDEAQADFFEAVAREFASWEVGRSDHQVWFIASHMKKCGCVTAVGREWVRVLEGYLGAREEFEAIEALAALHGPGGTDGHGGR